ncbi:ROK family protein [Bacteroidota bacterium]
MKMRLGVDIGGTKIEAALVDEKGKIIKKVRKLTRASKGKKVVISNIISAIKELDYKKVKFIGISFPGIINIKGVPVFAPNVKCLEGFNLKNFVVEKTGKKVLHDNDANCFAIAEHEFGSGKGYKDVIGLIIGTGLGAGVIIDNKIHRGKAIGGGELGHTIIDGKNTFMELCCGPAIERRYKKYGGKIKNPLVSDIYDSKEPAARKTIKETMHYIGIGIANIINTFDPEIIVLGGGLSNLKFYNELKKEVKKHAIPELFKNIKIVKNKLGDSSGVIGAAFL